MLGLVLVSVRVINPHYIAEVDTYSTLNLVNIFILNKERV